MLGLLQFAGESTPYGLKQLVAGSVGYFWTLQHAQLYTEPERLASGGYVTESARRPAGGASCTPSRRRGRARSREWRTETMSALAELREPALLKPFFGADSAGLAEAQLPANRARLADYERIRDSMSDDVPPGPRTALELGIRVERETIASGRSSPRTARVPPMATAAEPKPAELPSPAAATGRRCACTRFSPARSGPPAVPARGGPLRWRKAFGLGVPKDQWLKSPIQASWSSTRCGPCWWTPASTAPWR